MDCVVDERHDIAPQIARERIVATDKAMLRRLFECHPERWKGGAVARVIEAARIVEPRPEPDPEPIVIAEPESASVSPEAEPEIVLVEKVNICGSNPIVYSAAPVSQEDRRYSISEIQRETCNHFGISSYELKSERRTLNVVIPRQIAMYLCQKLTTNSYPKIGLRFGGRDHTTALHAVQKIARVRPINPEIEESIQAIAKRLGVEAV